MPTSTLAEAPPVEPKTIDIASNDHDVTVFGEDPMNLETWIGDELGLAITAKGDFNGDYIRDILIGANGDDGPGNERDHAGATYIIFGDPFLPDQIDIAEAIGQRVPDICIYGEEVGLPSSLGWAVGDNLGEVVTAGDLDNDGFDDIIVSSTLADGPQNTRPDSGEVYITFGKSQEDWDQMRPLPDDPVIFDIKGAAGPKPDVTILSADAEDVLGCGLTTGDVNGDGIDDLIVGACYGDGPNNERKDAGEAYVFLGRSFEEWQNISPIDLRSSPSLADIIFYGADDGDKLGSAMASTVTSRTNLNPRGDTNGDAIDDLAVGARHADGLGNEKTDSGEVYLFFGRDYDSWSALSPIDLLFTNADVTVYGVDEGDNLSSFLGLSLGDVNGDELDDLLIGAPLASGQGNLKPTSGEVYAILGQNTWASIVDLSTTPADAIFYGLDAGDWLGSSVASGDVDFDFTDDILIGAPGGDGPGNERPDNAGEAYVIFTFPAEKNIELAVPDAAQIIIYGAETYDNLGYAISSGDLNGDEMDDVLVGAPYAYGPMNSRPEAGETYVILGH